MKAIKAALAAFLSGEGFMAMALLFILVLMLAGCTSSPPPEPVKQETPRRIGYPDLARMETPTSEGRQPIERLAVCEEIFRDGGEAQDCYVVLSMVDKAEEGVR